MQFLMLMIPGIYQPGNKVPAGFRPDAESLERMMRFNEEMSAEITILSLNGLHPPATGVRVSFPDGKPVVTDGPFIEAKEVLGGYWHLEAQSREQVLKWAARCPAEPGDVIEIRQVFDLADFGIRK